MPTMTALGYPRDWKAISARVRFERAGGRCEECGALHGAADAATGKRVVLACAHVVDPDPAAVSESNLKALCQTCHFRADADLHQRHAAQTRAFKKGGQLPLFAPAAMRPRERAPRIPPSMSSDASRYAPSDGRNRRTRRSNAPPAHF